MARDEKVDRAAGDSSDEDADGSTGWRGARVSRRSFIRTGTLGAVAVGVVGAAPGLSGLLDGASADAPAVTGALSEAETVAPALSGPIVAHVTDAATGELSIYLGEREVTYQDPVLVQHLLRAVR